MPASREDLEGTGTLRSHPTCLTTYSSNIHPALLAVGSYSTAVELWNWGVLKPSGHLAERGNQVRSPRLAAFPAAFQSAAWTLEGSSRWRTNGRWLSSCVLTMGINSSGFLVTMYHSFQNSWVVRVREVLDSGNRDRGDGPSKILSKVCLPVKGGDLISEILLLLYATAVAECHVMEKREGWKGGNTHCSRKELNGFCYGTKPKTIQQKSVRKNIWNKTEIWKQWKMLLKLNKLDPDHSPK